MILPNDGKNKKKIVYPDMKRHLQRNTKWPSFPLLNPATWRTKDTSATFFVGFEDFSLSLYQLSDILPLPAHTSMIETHNWTSTHLKITTYSFSFIWKSCDFHMGKKLVKALQIFYVTFTRGISSSVTHTLPLKPNSRNTARSLHNCGTLTHIFYQNVLHITVKLGS